MTIPSEGDGARRVQEQIQGINRLTTRRIYGIVFPVFPSFFLDFLQYLFFLRRSCRTEERKQISYPSGTDPSGKSAGLKCIYHFCPDTKTLNSFANVSGFA